MASGFFVESGAHDGTSLSNTVFLEANRNWTGLLVEANPELFEMLVSSSNRTASTAINACLSPSGKREVLDFALGGFLGGLTGYMSEAHDHRMKSEIKAAGDAAGPTNTGRTVSVTCWPLHEMMAALGKTRVDYWSLDTEGSEAAILNATDFDKVDVSVMTVEVNDAQARANVEIVMATKPFKLHSVLGSDLHTLQPPDALLRMLNLHGTAATSRDQGDLYKVLVLDRHCKDIIAPLLRVSELRAQGITLHLLLEQERQAIPDVPAIYFVHPTPENVERIIQDAQQQLYDVMHVNFATSVPSRLLEQLASGVVKANAVGRVAKLFDEYLSFIALEPSCFSLGLQDSYLALNDPTARDTQIESAVGQIVDGLFSVLVTLGVVPIIRCPKGGAAEHVAAALEGKLRDHLKARSNLFSEGASALAATLSRPLLVLLDRNFDLSVMLQHAWSYKPLVQDVLGLKLNRVTLAPDTAGLPPGAGLLPQHAKKSYDVDDKDFFWEAAGALPFPKVAEEVESQLQKYKAAVDEINSKTAGGGDEAILDHEEMLRRNTQNLMSAVSSLPELQEKKKVLDKHTNLATSLLGAIKGRGLDGFYNLEEDLLTGKGDSAGLLKLLQGAKGTAADKLRLGLVQLLAAESAPSEAELAELTGALTAAGVPDTTALTYVARLRRNRLVGSARPAPGQGALGAPSQGNLLDWADKALGQGISSVTRSVKNLLSGARQAPVAAALEALMDGKQGTQEFDSFAVMDPKLPPGRTGLDRAKGPFREALVFMIGGGNYLERESLAAWASRSTPPRQVLYGATEMLAGEEFLHQLEELGRRSGIAPAAPAAAAAAAGGAP
ncbi:hypothetical protein OEZ85_013119 [Tetradesmus obliquus]|uniref:Methyltransferase FkbM domain-containing protein n=1 Tax=Tetradesmus obliquus TaxID=3088 RepID=A0ABY8U7L1_TETOB|nr:hypothetical protein OEZ85_013119 [Tetradesmus obliquus]